MAIIWLLKFTRGIMNMKNKLLIFSIFLFLLVFSSGIVFAQDSNIPLVENGEVSGDVEISAINPFSSTNGELVYEIPEGVSEIKSANVVVASYSGSGAPTYGLTTNISLKTNNVTDVLEYANLTFSENTANNPVIYPITDFTSKQYSEYQSLINITDKVKSLSCGDKITISVNNTRLSDYSFDGRIKMIALIFAYDDGDGDKISYWLNIGQAWTKETLTTVFKTQEFNDSFESVSLDSIALSSYDATYRLNGELLTDPIQEQGSYYIRDSWDITDNFKLSQDNNFTYTSSKTSAYGSYKAVVQLLKINSLEKPVISATVAPQYANTVFAGVYNTLTITVKDENKKVNGSVVLLIGDEEIASSNLSIDSNESVKITLIDFTIRPIDESTVNGANNTKVTYTLNILDDKGSILNSTNVTYSVLYNGNLGKDFAYPAFNASVNRVYNITGDVIVLKQDTSAYMGSAVTSKESIFEVNDSDVFESLLYVSYNWDKIVGGDFNAWNITFNDEMISPIASYRDQSNLGSYGKYGYGLVVYNVTDLIKSGNNTLVLNKSSGGCAVYPASLIVMIDDNQSDTFKLVYIAENADLLSKPANIESGSYSFMDVEAENCINSTLYVFAAGAQSGEGNIVVNENATFENVWNGTTSSLDYYVVDMANMTEDNNVIYFQATGSTILALHDILVLEFEKSNPEVNLTAPSVEKYFGGSQRFVVYLFDGDGNPLSNESISIDINGITYNRTTNENGSSSITLGLNSGEYDVVVKYKGSDIYKPCEVNSTVTIKSTIGGKDITKVYRNGTQYFANFTDNEGNPLANGTKVTFNINGVMYERKVNENGTAKLNINLNQGTYILTAINPFNNESSANTVTVIPKIVENSDLVKYYRNASQYVVKVLGDDGNPVGANETVTFNINGVMYERKTNESGYAKLNINLQPGTYVITAMYGGSLVANNITVKPVLSAEDVSMKYLDGTQFKATLLDGQGNPFANQTITFNINGVFYNRTTDSEGIAKLNIRLIAGEYIITSMYENGAAISNKVTIS